MILGSACLTCDFNCFGCEDVGVILRNYHSRSSSAAIKLWEKGRNLSQDKNKQSCKDIRNTETVFSWSLTLPSPSWFAKLPTNTQNTSNSAILGVVWRGCRGKADVGGTGDVFSRCWQRDSHSPIFVDRDRPGDFWEDQEEPADFPAAGPAQLSCPLQRRSEEVTAAPRGMYVKNQGPSQKRSSRDIQFVNTLRLEISFCELLVFCVLVLLWVLYKIGLNSYPLAVCIFYWLLVPERLRVLKCGFFFFWGQNLQALIGWGTISVTSRRDAN